MRTFVRLLPRLLFLGIAAAALLVLAERERSAQADALPPITTPAPPEAPSLPPVPPPSLPAPPPVTPPSLPAPPPLPTLPALPSPPVPIPPPLPSVAVPGLPGPPAPAPPDLPAVPTAPEVPAAPAVDPDRVTGIVGPLPGVPEVAAPEPLLPELPAVPDVPVPLDRVLELGATPAPDAPAPANSPDDTPSQLLAVPPASRVNPGDAFGVLLGGDVTLAPARAPPGGAPGSPHPCPGGGSPHPTRTDPAAFLDPATDDASCRAGLLVEARAYASTLLRDPLLRPD